MNTKQLLLLVFLGFCQVSIIYRPAPFEEYEPVYMSRQNLNQSVKATAPQKMLVPGKIYVYGNYIYINEKYRGVHIIDNTNINAPVKKAFIEVPGCLDIAVKNNIMYVDNAVDLVSLDISNLNNIQVVNRQENVFPPILAPDGRNAFAYNYDPQKGFIVSWRKYINR
ncbi:MAG: hypothetical protein MUE85_00725 [Microscillaceae bacterium]|jgi:hypothetical protein|nr:hypothetical protein [Microscillaceae bacterium]